MAYYECLNNNDHINIGDKFNVSLTGSHNKTITATVCYIYKDDKTTVCLLGDVSLGNANWSTQCNYAWNYSINIKGKEYTGLCRIPTLEQIYSKCAGYIREIFIIGFLQDMITLTVGLSTITAACSTTDLAPFMVLHLSLKLLYNHILYL